MTVAPRLSGFTFIKNGLTLGYPIKESIESIAPLCDEVIINVGFDGPGCNQDDGTWDYLTNYFTDPKYKFLKSYWDPELTSKGLILSEQTNIALAHCQGKYCQYIQGDEALHEKDYESIQNSLMLLDGNDHIDGLIFKYHHFYGSTDIVKKTRNIYRREVRLIRNGVGVKSYLDAQGFKDKNGEKLKCFEIDAHIYHYGWSRGEKLMSKKVKSFGKLYHGSDHQEDEFKFQRIWGLKLFQGTHPAVMKNWIESNKDDLNIMSLPMRLEWKNIGLAISDFIESLTGYRIGEYKNFNKQN